MSTTPNPDAKDPSRFNAEEVGNRLEPFVGNYDGSAQLSLAVSAKRQADALERIASILEGNSSHGYFDARVVSA